MVIIFLENKLGVNPYLAKSWKIFPKNGRSLRAFSGKYFQAFSKLLISGHQWGVILEKFSRRILSLPSQEKNKKNCLEKISRCLSESWPGFSVFEFLFQILDYGKIFQKKNLESRPENLPIWIHRQGPFGRSGDEGWASIFENSEIKSVNA